MGGLRLESRRGEHDREGWSVLLLYAYGTFGRLIGTGKDV
jgi:hypothetical protein